MNSVRNLFVTGFSAPLGSLLVERLARRFAPGATLTCLVESSRLDLARDRAAEIQRRLVLPEGALRLVEGDITRYDLGCGPTERRERQTSDIYHLAASADLSPSRDEAYRFNVEGTRHLLDMASRCPKLRRFHYLSSCFVSGGHDGLFLEGEFQVEQSFRNAFEETKFLAELELRQRMSRGLEATVYRPSLIVGDGRRGSDLDPQGIELLKFLLRLSSWSLAPVLGDPQRYRVNAVPRTFVADAIDYLGDLAHSRGRVYHLCDPSAPTVQDLLKHLQPDSAKRAVSLPLPPRLARWAVGRSSRLRRRVGASPEMLDYVTSPTRYSSLNALRDLAPAHISCPPLASYVTRLLAQQAAAEESASAVVA